MNSSYGTYGKLAAQQKCDKFTHQATATKGPGSGGLFNTGALKLFGGNGLFGRRRVNKANKADKFCSQARTERAATLDQGLLEGDLVDPGLLAPETAAADNTLLYGVLVFGALGIGAYLFLSE